MRFNVTLLLLTLLSLGVRCLNDKTEDIDSRQIEDLTQELNIVARNKTLELEDGLRAQLKKIEEIVETTYSAIDEQGLRNAWREGLGVDKDIDFEKDITFYQMKKSYENPCKSINFMFGVKSDFEVFQFNCDRFILCFLKFFDQMIKEFLSDIVLEGTINIVKSGSSNPISTFFTNLLIIEGPIKLKEELFAALYKYIDEAPEPNASYRALIDILVKLAFDHKAYEEEAKEFKKLRASSMIFFFYDTIITYMENNDVYLSAYDFIQPESNMVTNLDSMNPEYVSNHYMDILRQDLERFKQIRANYKKKTALTIYHKTYETYVDKNIKILCNYLDQQEDC